MEYEAVVVRRALDTELLVAAVSRAVDAECLAPTVVNAVALLAHAAGWAVRSPAIDVGLVPVLDSVGAGRLAAADACRIRISGSIAKPVQAIGVDKALLAVGARVAARPTAVDIGLSPVPHLIVTEVRLAAGAVRIAEAALAVSILVAFQPVDTRRTVRPPAIFIGLQAILETVRAGVDAAAIAADLVLCGVTRGVAAAATVLRAGGDVEAAGAGAVAGKEVLADLALAVVADTAAPGTAAFGSAAALPRQAAAASRIPTTPSRPPRALPASDLRSARRDGDAANARVQRSNCLLSMGTSG